MFAAAPLWEERTSTGCFLFLRFIMFLLSEVVKCPAAAGSWCDKYEKLVFEKGMHQTMKPDKLERPKSECPMHFCSFCPAQVFWLSICKDPTEVKRKWVKEPLKDMDAWKGMRHERGQVAKQDCLPLKLNSRAVTAGQALLP